MRNDFKKLCTPAKLYFVLSVMTCIFALFNGVKLITVFINLVIAFIWTVILSWICNKNFIGISWLLVLFPYFMMLLLFFGLLNKQVSATTKTMMMVMPPASINQMK
jgi:hypothetical protein